MATMRTAIDHLVVACADLDQGADRLARQLGVAPQPGGRHATMATHNRLLKLGSRCYLELIAIDPAARPPARPRWFALDQPAVRERAAAMPFLHTWVAATDYLTDAADLVPQLGTITPFTRGRFAWRFTLTDDGAMPFDGLLPALIQWEADGEGNVAHPTDVLPDSGCSLLTLALTHPRADELRALFRALRISGPVELAAGGPAIGARLRTPGGEVLLR
jgi:hypothetical protein